MSDEEIETPTIIETFRVTESQEINKISLALSKAQGQMLNAHKGKTNPFYKSDYSDLAACWDACRKPLADNELAVIQTHAISDKGDVILTTRLLHSSGQFFTGTLSIRPTKNDPQMYVSATTYGRRCGLCAMVGISPADDDGNNISLGKKPEVKRTSGKGKGKGKTATVVDDKEGNNAKDVTDTSTDDDF